MRDVASLALMVLGFAAWVTAHVTLLVGLARRRPRSRALAALALPPLAPYWGWRTEMRARSIAWLASALAYGAAWVLAA